jgi:hypothetical protein
MKKFFILVIALFAFSFAKSQVRLVQFSGVVVSADSLYPIPFTSIMVHNSARGTVSDYYGFFTFVAYEQDTIEFSAIGYRKVKFIIPDSLEDGRYSLIQVLKRDTIALPTIDIYPWPTREQFKTSFLNLDLPDNDLIRAQKNLDPAGLPKNAGGADPYMSYKYSMNQQQSKLYYAGQAQQISLLNPLAWAKFIDAWRSGAFKNKDKKTN